MDHKSTSICKTLNVFISLWESVFWYTSFRCCQTFAWPCSIFLPSIDFHFVFEFHKICWGSCLVHTNAATNGAICGLIITSHILSVYKTVTYEWVDGHFWFFDNLFSNEIIDVNDRTFLCFVVDWVNYSDVSDCRSLFLLWVVNGFRSIFYLFGCWNERDD